MPIDSEDRLKGCIDRIFIKVLLENCLFRRGIVWMAFNLTVCLTLMKLPCLILSITCVNSLLVLYKNVGSKSAKFDNPPN